MEAKFRNSMTFLALKEQGIKWANIRQNEDSGKHTAYFYASQTDLEKHENIISHCYVTDEAVEALKEGNKQSVSFCECSQDEGRTWVPLLCVGQGVTGTKGSNVLTIEL